MPLTRKILSGIADFFIPRHCPLCQATLPFGEGRIVCAPCLDSLERLSSPWCPKCGKPFASEATLSHAPDHLCADCRNGGRAFDRARALGPHEGLIREMVHLLKFRGRASLAREIGPALARLARREFPETAAADGAIVTFVPVDPVRWRERGYDQAMLLARETAAELGLPWEKLLERAGTAPSQTGLPAGRRKRNLRGVFAVPAPERVLGRPILLVDDVFTTGSTASACARSLKRAGAEGVDILTVCHTTQEIPLAG